MPARGLVQVAAVKSCPRTGTIWYGGGEGIRTPGALAGSADFKSAAFDHSATPPERRSLPQDRGSAWRVPDGDAAGGGMRRRRHGHRAHPPEPARRGPGGAGRRHGDRRCGARRGVLAPRCGDDPATGCGPGRRRRRRPLRGPRVLARGDRHGDGIVRRVRRGHAQPEPDLRRELPLGRLGKLGKLCDERPVFAGRDAERLAVLRRVRQRNRDAHAELRPDHVPMGELGGLRRVRRCVGVRAGLDARLRQRRLLRARGLPVRLHVGRLRAHPRVPAHPPGDERPRGQQLPLLWDRQVAVLPALLRLEHGLRRL